MPHLIPVIAFLLAFAPAVATAVPITYQYGGTLIFIGGTFTGTLIYDPDAAASAGPHPDPGSRLFAQGAVSIESDPDRFQGPTSFSAPDTSASFCNCDPSVLGDFLIFTGIVGLKRLRVTFEDASGTMFTSIELPDDLIGLPGARVSYTDFGTGLGFDGPITSLTRAGQADEPATLLLFLLGLALTSLWSVGSRRRSITAAFGYQKAA